MPYSPEVSQCCQAQGLNKHPFGLVQVISAELNRVVVELLQQLLFWQERQKAQDPLKAAKKKRLVSGLRSASKLNTFTRHA